MSYNIIGDIAGQFKTLQALLKQMPAGEPISVGDCIDRGPQSVEVVEFFRDNGRAVLGNHEDMFLEYIDGNEGWGKPYPQGCYLRNGGNATLNQFTTASGTIDIPVELVKYLRGLRRQITILEPSVDGHDGLLITHAPINPNPVSRKCFDYNRLWNRSPRVERRGNFYQVFGHNSHWDMQSFADDTGIYARCLDTHQPMLVGMHWPSLEVFTQEFI